MTDINPYFTDYEQQRRLLERMRQAAPSVVQEAQRQVEQFYGNSNPGNKLGQGGLHELPDLVGFSNKGFGGM